MPLERLKTQIQARQRLITNHFLSEELLRDAWIIPVQTQYVKGGGDMYHNWTEKPTRSIKFKELQTQLDIKIDVLKAWIIEQELHNDFGAEIFDRFIFMKEAIRWNYTNMTIGDLPIHYLNLAANNLEMVGKVRIIEDTEPANPANHSWRISVEVVATFEDQVLEALRQSLRKTA